MKFHWKSTNNIIELFSSQWNWTVYGIIQFPGGFFQIKQWLHIYLQASQIIHVSFRPNKESLFFLNN